MSDDQGPWGRQTPPPPPPRRATPWRRPILLLVALAAAAGLAWLATRFPAQLSGYDWGYSAYAIGLVVLCVSALLARRLRFGQVARYGALWAAIIGVLLVGYTLRDELAALGPRILSEIVPGRAVPAGPHSLTLTRSEDGDYYVMGEVNGAPVRFLVDTGASDIVLSPDDAARIGINVAALKYDEPYASANGVGYGARYTVSSLSVGSISLGPTLLAVNKAPMSQSLLGMTFLKRLDSFEFEGHQLILRGRP